VELGDSLGVKLKQRLWPASLLNASSDIQKLGTLRRQYFQDFKDRKGEIVPEACLASTRETSW
jgi:predicted GNAT superfamily acetyltransferase